MRSRAEASTCDWEGAAGALAGAVWLLLYTGRLSLLRNPDLIPRGFERVGASILCRAHHHAAGVLSGKFRAIRALARGLFFESRHHNLNRSGPCIAQSLPGPDKGISTIAAALETQGAIRCF